MASTASGQLRLRSGEVDGGELVHAHGVVGDHDRGGRLQEALADVLHLGLHLEHALLVLGRELVEAGDVLGRLGSGAGPASRDTGRSPSGVQSDIRLLLGLWAPRTWLVPYVHN